MKKNLPMAKVIDLWLLYKKDGVKTSTFAYYRRVGEKILKSEWDKYYSFSVKDDIITDLSNSLSTKYSPKSIKDIVTIANQILNFAYNKGYCKKDFREHIKIHIKKNNPEVLSVNEQKILTSFLLTEPNPSKIGVLLSLYTGLRLGELCGLQWKDINFSKNTININKTIQRIENNDRGTFLLIGSPKTISSERTIPIPDFLIPLLKNIQSENDFDYVTTGMEIFTQPRTYQARLKSYLKKCNLPPYHFHTLRHTFASRAIELGFDPKSLSEILGHSNVKITLDLYVHPSLESKRAQMNRFENLV